MNPTRGLLLSPRRRIATILSHAASSSPSTPLAAAAAATTTSTTTDTLLAGHDSTQVKLMQEELIRVNERDQVLGPGTKVECHRIQPDGTIPLHRAFSVFLFDQDNRLLMQQRAAEKITFPLVWTNTCCSHPLFTPSEMDPVMGIKRAAQRKLEHELGIPPSQVPLSEFHHVATILYKANCDDGVWGEHEVDHVLAIRANVTLDINLNEVASTRWFTRKELDVFRQSKTVFSPWFARIAVSLLPEWWAQLEKNGKVAKNEDDKKIMMM